MGADYGLEKTRANLDQTPSDFAERGIPVLVVGTRAYSSCGSAWQDDFARMFPDLAAKYGDLPYPDFKNGIDGHPDLMQPDLDHPDALGQAAVVVKMLPMVKALIAQIGQP